MLADNVQNARHPLIYGPIYASSHDRSHALGNGCSINIIYIYINI